MLRPGIPTAKDGVVEAAGGFPVFASELEAIAAAVLEAG